MGKHSKNNRAEQAEMVVTAETPVEEIAVEAAVVEKTAEQLEIEALQAKLAEETAKVEQAGRSAWETKTAARNPALVLGSLRKANEADKALLGHTHGEVCEIACRKDGCSTRRLINKQDAFQVRFCEAHKTEGRKAARKEAKAIVASTPEALKAKLLKEIAKQEAKAAKLNPAIVTVTEATDTASAG